MNRLALESFYWNQKKSIRKIAKIYNCSYSYMYNKFKQYRIKTRKKTDFNKGQFELGHMAWNKGRPRTEKEKQNISNSVSGRKNQAFGKYGDDSHHWRGGTRSDYGRLIWERTNKRKVPKGFVIHHIDKNHQNNKIENLQLVSYSDHAKIHKRYHNFLHEVDEEFLEKWANLIFKEASSKLTLGANVKPFMAEMLQEAGYNVVPKPEITIKDIEGWADKIREDVENHKDWSYLADGIGEMLKEEYQIVGIKVKK